MRRETVEDRQTVTRWMETNTLMTHAQREINRQSEIDSQRCLSECWRVDKHFYQVYGREKERSIRKQPPPCRASDAYMAQVKESEGRRRRDCLRPLLAEPSRTLQTFPTPGPSPLSLASPRWRIVNLLGFCSAGLSSMPFIPVSISVRSEPRVYISGASLRSVHD